MDPSDSDDADMITSKATQGYLEGLADNKQEFEVSSRCSSGISTRT